MLCCVGCIIACARSSVEELLGLQPPPAATISAFQPSPVARCGNSLPPAFSCDPCQLTASTCTSVPQATRLLAAVIAKNAIGSSWRKTMGTREWSRIPDDEKAAVHSLSLGLLLSDPSARVAVQLTEILTNVARFDFPGKWPDLLSHLLAAAAPGSAAQVGALWGGEGRFVALMLWECRL